ncbi:MAG: PorT family protein [Hymenobacter sp.]|nr:MAG: PorT family protein [Hymenobacter sp.]
MGLMSLFTFQPELLYPQKGASYASTTDLPLRLPYLGMPLVFHVNTGGLFLEAGPQAGFLVAAKSQAESTSTDVRTALTRSILATCLGWATSSSAA